MQTTKIDAKDKTIRVGDGLAWATYSLTDGTLLRKGVDFCAPTAAQLIAFEAAAKAAVESFVAAPVVHVSTERKARAYDNLQNEGYCNGGYNPYRDGDDNAYRRGRGDGFDENDII